MDGLNRMGRVVMLDVLDGTKHETLKSDPMHWCYLKHFSSAELNMERERKLEEPQQSLVGIITTLFLFACFSVLPHTHQPTSTFNFVTASHLLAFSQKSKFLQKEKKKFRFLYVGISMNLFTQSWTVS